jgi:Cft2 family RNA processing exonuclease
MAHTGALPYAVAHLGLKTDHIYCTLPVQHLGHLALYELLASRHDISDFDAFTYDDIDIAFEAIKGVRFGQQVTISDPGSAPCRTACANYRPCPSVHRRHIHHLAYIASSSGTITQFPPCMYSCK